MGATATWLDEAVGPMGLVGRPGWSVGRPAHGANCPQLRLSGCPGLPCPNACVMAYPKLNSFGLWACFDPFELERRALISLRSDWSWQSPSTTCIFHRFRSCNRISYGTSPLHSIIIKGHGRLRERKPYKYIYLSLSLPFIFTLAFPTTTWCSSYVSKTFEVALACLPSLGQPKVCLPDGVCWYFVTSRIKSTSARIPM